MGRRSGAAHLRAGRILARRSRSDFSRSAVEGAEITTAVENAYIGLHATELPAGTGGALVSFGVRDIQKAKSWLAANDVKMLGEVVEIPETVKLLNFEDPDGNALMFYEPYLGL